jgi:hypothetical protein
MLQSIDYVEKRFQSINHNKLTTLPVDGGKARIEWKKIKLLKGDLVFLQCDFPAI